MTNLKKIIIVLALKLFFSDIVNAQPPVPPYQSMIPFDLTLQQILRISVSNGGNIEFVFNTMEQYQSGIATAFSTTNFAVASSTDWELNFGAEDPTLMGTDLANTPPNPPFEQNTMLLNNVGFTIVTTGAYTFGAELTLNNNANVTANGLGEFGGIPASQNPMISPGTGNAGDIGDNRFTISWECGTQVAGGTFSMNLTTILSQPLAPDRYVTSVVLDINPQ